MRIFLLFPHHLFDDITPLMAYEKVWLIEEFLFFKQYKFHKQKIAFHRYSMKAYEAKLKAAGLQVEYIDAQMGISDVRHLIPHLQTWNILELGYYDPVDNWLTKRLNDGLSKSQIKVNTSPTPLFINTTEDLEIYGKGKKRYFQTDFYTYQRKKRQILVENGNQPMGGQWTFDVDNRKKYPSKKVPPKSPTTDITEYHKEAWQYTESNFSENYGVLDTSIAYPHDTTSANKWLSDFLKNRFKEFGPYEDAIVAEENILNHSVLTPMLNVGLLTPQYVINESIVYASKNDIPINSLEGFVRQILGWREFIRWIYSVEGTRQRTTNYWGFKRKIPASFYDGTTGIVPIDITIKKLLKTGYNHHIERLMVLSNFMLLCEFDPDEVYRWFMEMYIDAYDWVMVPNVYGMGQFSDGGLMCTKPYISGSNYLFKMSDYPKGQDWANIWDALFWRFMDVHRSFFLSNPRLGMLIRTYDKWDDSKKKLIHRVANEFLDGL